MAGHLIYLFMWGYQESYRISIQLLARNVLKELGVEHEAPTAKTQTKCV